MRYTSENRFSFAVLMAFLALTAVAPALASAAADDRDAVRPEGGRVSQNNREQESKELYSASADEVSTIEVPEMQFAMIDGAGDPNTVPEFSEAVTALFTVSYTLKFMVAQEQLGPDYMVKPLEGLWWTDDEGNFNIDNKNDWKWTVMIRQPDYVTGEIFAKALEQARKNRNLPALDKMRFESFHEGLSAQIQHIGPYSEEGPTIKKLHDFIAENGYQRRGRHHEIYFGDPRSTKPEELKTILRQPFK